MTDWIGILLLVPLSLMFGAFVVYGVWTGFQGKGINDQNLITISAILLIFALVGLRICFKSRRQAKTELRKLED